MTRTLLQEEETSYRGCKEDPCACGRLLTALLSDSHDTEALGRLIWMQPKEDAVAKP
jgi:hypothetical protein